MIIRLTIIFIIFTTTSSWCQETITGTVIFKEDNSTAPGIYVIEKGTENKTVTDNDGKFKLIVGKSNVILVFSGVGVRTQEFEIDEKSDILIKIKLDCHKDFFDSRQFHIYANSGLINNPLGGQIDIASPWIFRGVIKATYSLQTNLADNKMQTGKVELAHYISNCDFDIDFRWGYRQLTFENNLDFKVNSVETDLNLRDLKFIAGYSNLNFAKLESAQKENLTGVVVGMGRYFYNPLHTTAIVKLGLYKDKVEYQALINGEYRRFLCFLKFYKLSSFNEISIGLGTGFDYSKKRRK